MPLKVLIGPIAADRVPLMPASCQGAEAYRSVRPIQKIAITAEVGALARHEGREPAERV